MAENNPYAPPESGAPPPDAGLQLASRADFGIRAGARIIDFVITMTNSVVAIFVLGVYGAIKGIQINPKQDGLSLSGILIGMVTTLVYQAAAESVGGASMGKLVCGLRVIDPKGRAIGIVPAVVRNLGYIIDSLFFGAVAYTVMKTDPWFRRYGDRWANTIVVRARGVPESSGLTLGRALLGALFGCFCDVVLTAVLMRGTILSGG